MVALASAGSLLAVGCAPLGQCPDKWIQWIPVDSPTGVLADCLVKEGAPRGPVMLLHRTFVIAALQGNRN